MAGLSRHALSERLEVATTLVRSGVLRPGRPDRTVRALASLRRWGPTLAGGYTVAAVRDPDAVAVVDDNRTVTFAQLNDRATRLAHGFAQLGVGPRERVALLCRNHAGLIEAMVACSMLGADIVLVNTGLAPRQIAAVVATNNVVAIVADEEFIGVLDDVPARVHRISAGAEPGTGSMTEALIAAAPATPIGPPARTGRVIVLTSGTTGAPRGARRPTPPGLGAAAAILSRIPLRAGERIVVPAPIFHTWGFAAVQLAMSLRATLILSRRFTPTELLATIERNRATALFAVPVTLQRLLELPAPVRDRYDTSSLRIVASSGSALPAACVTGFLDAFGDVLHNLYGSTEVSWASIADPTDLRADPATAGRPPLGTRIAILDENGAPVPTGRTGRIFVGNAMLFEGYTGSRAPDPAADQTAPTARTAPDTGPDADPGPRSGKELVDGLMATGDRGRFDADGRLFVVGRDDDMIVSGGENVFPREVEDVIGALPGVVEVAVAGVPDEVFGQRFAAHVVLAPGVELTAEEIRDHVRGRLARHSVPRDVIFRPELTRNATGKVVLRALRETAANPLEDTGRGQGASR